MDGEARAPGKISADHSEEVGRRRCSVRLLGPSGRAAPGCERSHAKLGSPRWFRIPVSWLAGTGHRRAGPLLRRRSRARPHPGREDPIHGAGRLAALVLAPVQLDGDSAGPRDAAIGEVAGARPSREMGTRQAFAGRVPSLRRSARQRGPYVAAHLRRTRCDGRRAPDFSEGARRGVGRPRRRRSLARGIGKPSVPSSGSGHLGLVPGHVRGSGGLVPVLGQEHQWRP
mmetsp:Transcript_84512/g.244306  ORF Transcript_84512/g.244306 Transcript_84512/m.244306 type:complete len:228 (-) Transcript_84512:1754-2437(-)